MAAGQDEDLELRPRRGLYLGLVWLVFLISPMVDLATKDQATWRIATGATGLAIFIAMYVRLFFLGGLFRNRTRRMVAKARPLAVGLVVLAFGLPLLLGDTYVGLGIYASAAAVIVSPPQRMWHTIVAFAAANAIMLGIVGVDAGTFFSLMLIVMISPIMIAGMRKLVLMNDALQVAHEENARLAVSEERLRFARDLHDLLGHSLSLIVLKSELAGRLAERDPARVAGEVRDIESVARQALVEVREAVSGYRRSLSEELAGARSALAAAEIEVELPASGAPLPAPVESLLGWAVREATTNILRHSHATRVVVELTPTHTDVRLAVSDNGVGASTVDIGNGLRGLAERMAAAGGSMLAGPGSGGGFELVVTVPIDAPSYAAAPRPPDVAEKVLGG